MTRSTAGQLLEGLLLIFKQAATATPAEGEQVQEVGLHVTGSISHAQQRMLLELGERTQTGYTTQADGAGLWVTFTGAEVVENAGLPTELRHS